MDLSGTYSSEFRLMKVNTESWSDEAEVPGVVSATIDKNCTDDYPLLESGSFTIDTGINEEFEPGWYRLEMLATDPSGEHERLAIATQRLQSVRGFINRGYDAKEVVGQSVLQPLAKRKTSVGMHVPKGINAIDWLLNQIFSISVAPVQVDGDGFIIDEHYVFDPGTTYLRAAWDILGLGDWCIDISGEGLVTLRPKPTEASIILDQSTKGLLLPGINYDYDLTNIPNHYVAIASNGTIAEVYNDQEDSNTSVQARAGLIQDYIDTSPTPINGEGLYGYVRRRLEEESTVYRKYSYTREYVDGVGPFDLISALLPEEGVYGDLRILSQSLRCSYGITVTETAGEEIQEYVQ